MRILLIEPDERQASFIKQGLRSACFTIDVATSGTQGSYLARTNEYAAIISEFRLPDKAGSEVCKELRHKQKSTPILIISTMSDSVTKVECLNSGADDYITKPFYFEEFLARLRAILRRPKIIEQQTIIINDLELNSSKHIIKRGSRIITLTKKEFELLEYMMKNPDIVLSRGQIMEHVWDIHADIFSNTIETHILNLRRKINFLGTKKLIQTIPGRGYKLLPVEEPAKEKIQKIKFRRPRLSRKSYSTYSLST